MDPYRQQYPPYPGQPPPQQQQQQGAPPPHLRHAQPPPGQHYGAPPHLQGRPPHMYQGAPPPHHQQPYAPHIQGPPPHQQQPPHFQARGPMPSQRPPPGVIPPGQHYPPGTGAGGPYGAVPPLGRPAPQGGAYGAQHQRVPRPAYGPGLLPPPGTVPPGSGPMNLGGPPGFINAPLPGASHFNKGVPTASGSTNGIPASAFVVGGALPEKMNTLFIGTIAPGINNVAMEKLLKTTGNLIKWKRVQDPTSHQWKAFGFAEYADADSLLRTLRVLGQDGQQPKGEKPVGLELTAMDGSGVVKALLVKADEKTRQFLDQYEESRPRTIHDTEKDKVALASAKVIIQKMKDGTLDTSEPEPQSDEKDDNVGEDSAPKKSEDQEMAEAEVSDEQKELIARELNFFRERAALKEKERREEEEKAERLRSKHHRDKDSSSQSTSSSHRTAGRERAWGSNTTTLGTKLTDFVSAGSSRNETGVAVSSTAALTTTGANQDPGADSEEEERSRQERKDREEERAYEDREFRWEQREVERLRQCEKDRVRDSEYTLEQQSSSAAMAYRFAQWNDDVERERRHEEYYRDRSRWWQRRQAFLQKEERYDALDREGEKEEQEQEAARKAQEEAAASAAAAAAATSSVDRDGDSDMKDNSKTDANSISTTTSGNGALPGTPNSRSIDATVLPNQTTKLKLSLANTSGVLKRGGSESNSGVGTPTTGFSASEFEGGDEEKEAKKRRLLLPFAIGDDDAESASKRDNSGSELSQEEKEKMEREMKELIQSIPADAQGLWNWPIQWQYVFEDNSHILSGKIRPFASKKVVELLGVQEDELTNFVVEHIRQKKPPQELVDELRNALDEDADVLVMKIWRMLIFETESKARKLAANDGDPGFGPELENDGEGEEDPEREVDEDLELGRDDVKLVLLLLVLLVEDEVDDGPKIFSRAAL
ncbi:hypothetical protein BGZ76_010328 [Entomortierella beljakovae]|nr:hypothetical protein BGZ76_010328 [Entomortierella beljakovae]